MTDFDALERTNKADYMELDRPLKRPGMGIEIVGSCHGLVCMENSEKDIILWNPTTRKHFKLPKPDFEIPKESVYGYGFGYDKVSDDYKVLQILQFSVSENEVNIFSMKSKCWRKLPCFPYRLKYITADAVLAGGAFHWIVSRNQENQIAAFDLGTEYRLLPLPDDFKSEFHTSVVLLGESLCLKSKYSYSKCVDIWVMKMYAVKESWTKLLTVTESDFKSKPFYDVAPVAYSSCGHHVYMAQNDKLPLWYDLKNRKIRYCSVGTSSPSLDSMEHHMSFGSLVQIDGAISDSTVGYAKGRKRGQDTKKYSKKKRDGFMLRASS